MLYDFTMRYFDYSCFDDALLFQQRIIMLHLAPPRSTSSNTMQFVLLLQFSQANSRILNIFYISFIKYTTEEFAVRFLMFH